MTTVLQIVTDAYRESNLVAIGQVPTADEQEEGLLALNRLVRSVLGNEAGDPLTTVEEETDLSGWHPAGNSQLIFNNTGAKTLTLNPYPQNGERLRIQDAAGNFATFPVTVVGNGRLFEGVTSLVLDTDSFKEEYFYRDDLNDWKKISTLELTDEFPFPEEFDDMFIIGLAMRINPRNGAAMDQQSVAAYQRQRTLFRARYRQVSPQDMEEGFLRLTGVRRYYQTRF